MDAFSLAPSRLVGDLKRALEKAIDEGTLEARREDAYYVAALARQKLVPGVSDEDAARLIAAGGLSGEAAEAAEAREAAGDFDQPVEDVEAAELLACKDDCDDPAHRHGR